jgi:ABC-type branched-subunit amino acid transport system ATPase component/ABC-type branched-subunit amino acid transport system permease subunit
VGRALLAGTLVLAAAVPLAGLDGYTMRLINVSLVFVVLTTAFNFTLGHAGQLSLAHVGFFALGAYGVGLTTTAGLLSFWPALGVATLAAVAVAVGLGVPTVKLRTHYLALATLSFNEIVRLVLTNWKAVTRGTDGVLNIPAPSVLGLAVRGDVRWYYLLLAVTAGLVWLAARVAASRYGEAFAALRGSEVAAEAMGVDTVRLKVLALVLGAAYSAVAGGLYASLYTFISPEFFNIEILVSTLVMLLIGGAGTVLGPVVGGVALTFLPEWLRGIRQYYMIVYGLGIVALIVFFPRGLVGLAGRLLAERPGGRVPVRVAPAGAGAPGPPAAPAPAAAGGRLEIRGLTVRFGGLVAVDALDLTAEAGQIHGLIGPNGAGKTTVINVVTGLYRPQQGAVRLAGADLAGLRPSQVTRRGVARTFQTIRLFGEMSALRNVMVAGQCHARTHLGHAVAGVRARRERQALEAEGRALLARFGLAERADEPARSLPYGQQRLLEIARALATRPRLLCLDEPAAGLTHGEREELIRRLERLREDGLTLLLVEHNMPLVMRVCDRLTVLDFGRKIAEGPPAAVREDPAVVEAYLGARVAYA